MFGSRHGSRRVLNQCHEESDMLDRIGRSIGALALFTCALLLNEHAAFGLPDESDATSARPSDLERGTSLRQQLEAQLQEGIAEEWEGGELATDRGGIILHRMFRLPGNRYIHPLPPDPLRRDTFDEWCEHIGLFDSVPADTLEAIWDMYVDRINRVMIDRYPPVFELSAAVSAAPSPKNHAIASLFEEMIEHSKTARRDVNRTEDQLFRMLRGVEQGRFAEQIESWHLFRRWERTSIITLEVSGAEQHLSLLLDSEGVDWPNRHIQLAYEMEIAIAAERRFSHSQSVSADLMHIQASGFYDQANERYKPGTQQARDALREMQRATLPLHRRQWQYQRQMYDINTRYLTLLSLLLEPFDAERVYDRFMYRAFPEHFPNPYDLRRWFDSLLEDETTRDDLRENIQALREQYVTVQRGVNESLTFTIHEHEADLIITRRLDPNTQDSQRREIDAELQRRYENAIVFAARLVELLDGRERLVWVREELEELLEVDLERWFR